LAPARNCTVRVRFTPKATGLQSASLIIKSSDVGVPSASVALSGTGQ
jgi:hypothetical protein